MAMDFLGIPATSSPSERINSMAGRSFTAVWQSLSVFIETMCSRLWLDAHVLHIPTNRESAAAPQAAVHNIDDNQNDWLVLGGMREEKYGQRARLPA